MNFKTQTQREAATAPEFMRKSDYKKNHDSNNLFDNVNGQTCPQLDSFPRAASFVEDQREIQGKRSFDFTSFSPKELKKKKLFTDFFSPLFTVSLFSILNFIQTTPTPTSITSIFIPTTTITTIPTIIVLTVITVITTIPTTTTTLTLALTTTKTSLSTVENQNSEINEKQELIKTNHSINEIVTINNGNPSSKVKTFINFPEIPLLVNFRVHGWPLVKVGSTFAFDHLLKLPSTTSERLSTRFVGKGKLKKSELRSFDTHEVRGVFKVTETVTKQREDGLYQYITLSKIELSY